MTVAEALSSAIKLEKGGLRVYLDFARTAQGAVLRFGVNFRAS